MSAAVRAQAGQRIREAIAQIKLFEKSKTDWDHQQLGDAMKISHQQARALVATLAGRGDLEWADVVVRKRALVLTEAAKHPSARAA